MIDRTYFIFIHFFDVYWQLIRYFFKGCFYICVCSDFLFNLIMILKDADIMAICVCYSSVFNTYVLNKYIKMN